MSASFTESQVISLAPDAASVKAGKKLAKSSLWSRLEYSAQAIWGEIKGSGKNPYQVRIDTEELAFKCSCPSRKFPCKHALGVLLVYANEKPTFSQSSEPEWVSSWLNQRRTKAASKSVAASKPVDEKARQKRIAKREEKVAAGLFEVRKWLLDISRNGLLQLSERETAYFEQLAARMIDAQAPGIAAMFRNLGQLNRHADSWNLQALEGLCRLWLLLLAYEQAEKLAIGLREEVRNLVGWNPPKEALVQQAGIPDQWRILGMESWEENRITTHKYWLLGEESNLQAYVLQYQAPGQIQEFSLMPGTSLEGTLVQYGAGTSQRAIFKTSGKSSSISQLTGFPDIPACKDQLAEEYARNPWISQSVAVLEAVIPVTVGEELLLIDKNRKWMKIHASAETRWKLLAISGGESLILAGVTDGLTFQPLGCMWENQYLLFG